MADLPAALGRLFSSARELGIEKQVADLFIDIGAKAEIDATTNGAATRPVEDISPVQSRLPLRDTRDRESRCRSYMRDDWRDELRVTLMEIGETNVDDQRIIDAVKEPGQRIGPQMRGAIRRTLGRHMSQQPEYIPRPDGKWCLWRIAAPQLTGPTNDK